MFKFSKNISSMLLNKSINNKFKKIETAYVGAATVGASVWWFMEASNGPALNYWHLVS
jgi:hypothetical protein